MGSNSFLVIPSAVCHQQISGSQSVVSAMSRKRVLQEVNPNTLGADGVHRIVEKEKRKRTAKSEMESVAPMPPSSWAIEDFIEFFPQVKERAEVSIACSTATEDDPPLIFAWKNVHVFVQSIPQQVVVGANVAAPPFVLPVPLTVDGFKDALLAHVQTPGGSAPRERAVLPCTIGQVCLTCTNLSRLENDPWFIAVAAHNPLGLPLAAVVVPQPRTNSVTTAITSPPNAPCRLWG